MGVLRLAHLNTEAVAVMAMHLRPGDFGSIHYIGLAGKGWIPDFTMISGLEAMIKCKDKC
jgi:hypothetical protein